MESIRYSCEILMKFEFSRELFFRKIPKCQIHENPSHGRRVVACGRTNRQEDGHDEVNSRFSKFGEHTQTRKITSENEKIIIMKIMLEEERTLYRTDGLQYHLSASCSSV
jgi:hypothetical protein